MFTLEPNRLRQLTIGLGLGTIAFGVGPVLAPRWFAEFFGIALPKGGAGESIIRSVGARDAISGVGILSATIHGGRVGPWLLARLLADATDTVWVALAIRGGARSPRLRFLGAVAVGATILDLALYLGHRSAAPSGLRRTAEGGG